MPQTPGDAAGAERYTPALLFREADIRGPAGELLGIDVRGVVEGLGEVDRELAAVPRFERGAHPGPLRAAGQDRPGLAERGLPGLVRSRDVRHMGLALLVEVPDEDFDLVKGLVPGVPDLAGDFREERLRTLDLQGLLLAPEHLQLDLRRRRQALLLVGRVGRADDAESLGDVLVRQPPDAARAVRILFEPGQGDSGPGAELELLRRRVPASALQQRRELGPGLELEAVFPEVAQRVVEAERIGLLLAPVVGAR